MPHIEERTLSFGQAQIPEDEARQEIHNYLLEMMVGSSVADLKHSNSVELVMKTYPFFTPKFIQEAQQKGFLADKSKRPLIHWYEISTLRYLRKHGQEITRESALILTEIVADETEKVKSINRFRKRQF